MTTRTNGGRGAAAPTPTGRAPARTATVPIYTAEYKPAMMPEGRGNPLIEALPAICSSKDILKPMHRAPDINAAERRESASYRIMAVERLSGYIEPLDEHSELIDGILKMIPAGYVGRNPCDPAYARAVNRSYRFPVGTPPEPLGDPRGTTGLSATLLGYSGLGKTLVAERILSFLPQVLAHPQHGLLQIVYLKIECPPDGSAKALLRRFIETVDGLLGTDYLSAASSPNDQLVELVGRIAKLHHIGLVVLDEAQTLLKARAKDETHVVRFFVNLVNVLRIPILSLGTLHAGKLFSSTLHLGRRAGDSYVWEPMAFGDAGSTWHYFLSHLFDYQWTHEPADLDGPLSEAFYEQTQGIPAIVVRLFQLCQIRIITEADDTGEPEQRLTPDLVRKVAADRLVLVRPFVEALRQRHLRGTPGDPAAELKKLNGFVTAASLTARDKAGRGRDAPAVLLDELRAMGFDEDEARERVSAALQKVPNGTLKQLRKSATATGGSGGMPDDTLSATARRARGRGEDVEGALRAMRNGVSP